MKHHLSIQIKILPKTYLTMRKLMVFAGVSLLTIIPMSNAMAATDALLLSCMDYRLIDDTERYMSGQGLQNKYDYVILAGASLGAVTDQFPAWNTTFWEHLDVAIQLHKIHKVIILDHRDCGAYKVILGEDFSKDQAVETAIHSEKLHELQAQIIEKYPDMETELLLMNLDGEVEVIKKNDED